jgi:DNA-binding NtrC family response regulator
MTYVLLVDDDSSLCETLRLGLTKRGYAVTAAGSAEAGFERLLAEDFDVVITDVRMPGADGISLCEKIAANRPDVPVVVMTAFGSLEAAVAAIRAGAYDFISKPVQLDVLGIAIDRAAQTRALRDEVKRLRTGSERTGFGDLVGQSTAMQKVYDLVARVASSDVSVLITGESGTGKEVIAQSLHKRSRRAQGPFLPVNCSAMPEALLESELFGHTRGAFTDAREARTGLFVEARGGTVFLDEIGDMPISLQPKILRALQERRVRPVGSNTEVPIDVRIVAATNRDLEEAIEEKRFREDLYFRLNVIHVELPPLRSRGGDVLALAQHFLEGFARREGKAVAGIAPAAAQKILAYTWPGNVRELRNCMERAVTLARFEQVVVDDLPEKVKEYQSSHVIVAGEDPSELVSMEEVERRYVRRVLDAVDGNKAAAARILGFERKTLYRKFERWAQEDSKEAETKAKGDERGSG